MTRPSGSISQACPWPIRNQSEITMRHFQPFFFFSPAKNVARLSSSAPVANSSKKDLTCARVGDLERF
jgi:hypothetical protein